MAFTPFPPRQPAASARLPLTLISLEDWALATITGPDSEKYLQGQVTADVTELGENQHLLVAHCDAKGKMWSNLRLFRHGDGFAWIERRSVRDTQLAEMKKYAVFSKVTIAPNDDAVLLGVAGSRRVRRWRTISLRYRMSRIRVSWTVPPHFCGSACRQSVLW